MKPRLRLLAVALCLAFASPAAAQTMSPAQEVQVIARGDTTSAATDEQADAFANIRAAVAANERIRAIIERPFYPTSQPRPATLDQLMALFDAKIPEVQAMRSEVIVVRTELTRLQPVGTEASVAQVRLSNLIVENNIAFADQVVEYLDAVESALRSGVTGDRAALAQLRSTLGSAGVLLSRAAARDYRSRMALLPPAGFERPQIAALACFYDGLSAYSSGKYQLVSVEEARAGVTEATACMDEFLARGRAALEQHVATATRLKAFDDPGLQGAPLSTRLFDHVAAGRETLLAASNDLGQGMPFKDLNARYNPVLGAWEDTLAVIGTEQFNFASEVVR